MPRRDPTPQEISRLTEEIKSKWTPKERRRRKMGVPGDAVSGIRRVDTSQIPVTEEFRSEFYSWEFLTRSKQKKEAAKPVDPEPQVQEPIEYLEATEVPFGE